MSQSEIRQLRTTAPEIVAYKTQLGNCSLEVLAILCRAASDKTAVLAIIILLTFTARVHEIQPLYNTRQCSITGLLRADFERSKEFASTVQQEGGHYKAGTILGRGGFAPFAPPHPHFVHCHSSCMIYHFNVSNELVTKRQSIRIGDFFWIVSDTDVYARNEICIREKIMRCLANSGE